MDVMRSHLLLFLSSMPFLAVVSFFFPEVVVIAIVLTAVV